MKTALAASAVLNVLLIMMVASVIGWAGANASSSKEDIPRSVKGELLLTRGAWKKCRADLEKANRAYLDTIKAWEKSNEEIFAKWRALDRQRVQVPVPLQREMTDWFEAQNREHDYFYQRAREYGWVR